MIQYPITPPPNTTNDINNNNTHNEKETTALIQSNNNSSISVTATDISKLNINLKAKQSMEKIIKSVTPNALHVKSHTTLGTPGKNNNEQIENNMQIINDNNNNKGRNSENAIIKMKITKPINTPISVGNTKLWNK